MFRRNKSVLAMLAVFGMVGLSGVAQAAPVRATAATVNGVTSVPYGWVDFCNRYAGECDGAELPAQDIVYNDRAQREIERINRAVNKSVEPITDMDHWGVVDRWDYPLDGKGDCEDYALLKRKMLMEAGFPRQALLMTVVKDHAGEGHALLTIKTDRGEFILDNLVDTILPWEDTGYKFVKRQSQGDPNVWRSIGPATSAPLYTSNK